MGTSRKPGTLGNSESSDENKPSLSQLGEDKLCELDIQGVTAEFQPPSVNFVFNVGRARMAIGNPLKPIGAALKHLVWWPMPPPD